MKRKRVRMKTETKKKIGFANSGSKNGMWKGDEIGYNALHTYIKNNKPKPELCENCKNKKPFDLANISGEYKRDINDFEWLCRKCHMEKDGRMITLKKNHKKREINNLGRLKCNKCLEFKNKKDFSFDNRRCDNRRLSCRECEKKLYKISVEARK